MGISFSLHCPIANGRPNARMSIAWTRYVEQKIVICSEFRNSGVPELFCGGSKSVPLELIHGPWLGKQVRRAAAG